MGESVVDMCIITWMGSEAALLVLGERNIYWFRDSGGLKVMKRLQYNACCFHVYVTGNDIGSLCILCTEVYFYFLLS